MVVHQIVFVYSDWHNWREEQEQVMGYSNQRTSVTIKNKNQNVRNHSNRVIVNTLSSQVWFLLPSLKLVGVTTVKIADHYSKD